MVVSRFRRLDDRHPVSLNLYPMKSCFGLGLSRVGLAAAIAPWALGLVLWLILASAGHAGDYLYTATNSEINILHYNGTNSSIEVPRTIDGLPVTGIGPEAFSHCFMLTNISIPDCIKNIEYWAFYYCTNLTSITIPVSVKSIGSEAFVGCVNLKAIEVDSLNPYYSSVNGVLFDKLQTTLVAYPTGGDVTYAIPSSVTNIDFGAFASCTNLASLTIPSSVNIIGQWAFSDCVSLTNITIPGSVGIIGDHAFYSCAGLTNIEISPGVTNIEGSAFQNCDRLTRVTIPASVASIGEGPFFYCSRLTAIEVDASNPAYSSADGVLFNSDRTVLIECPGGKAGDYVIPNSVTGIGDWAFNQCFKMTGVLIPNSVTNIGRGAFMDCSALSQITIPESVIIIGGYSFSHCSGLGRITIPGSVASIGSEAFSFCYNLSAIDVDESNPFYRSVDGVLFNKEQTQLYQFPASKFLQNPRFNDGVYQIPGSVTFIGGWAFANSAGLTNVIIPNGVTSIGSGTFYGCDNLTTLTIPASVNRIEYRAVQYCSHLTGVYFKGNAPSLGSEVFDGDSFVTVYYLPATSGWDLTYGECPTKPWNLPSLAIRHSNLGAAANPLEFALAGASGQLVVVEVCSDLVHPAWTPFQTNIIRGDLFRFSDPQWTNTPSRFYRLCLP